MGKLNRFNANVPRQPGGAVLPSAEVRQAKLLEQANISLYSEDLSSAGPPSQAQLEYARQFFTNSRNPPELMYQCAKFRDFPRSEVPEVAFVGRSNVGKSSLLNALMNRTNSHLAKISTKPGHTKTLNVYGLGGNGTGCSRQGLLPKQLDAMKKEPNNWIGEGGMCIVDMPGYGAGSRAEWGAEILKYLEKRPQLKRAFLLVNLKHGLKETDRWLMQQLRENEIPHQILVSKIDTFVYYSGSLKPGLDKVTMGVDKLQSALKALKYDAGMDDSRVGRPPESDILGFSSIKGVVRGHQKLGIDGVRWAILQACGLADKVFPTQRTIELRAKSGRRSIDALDAVAKESLVNG